LKVYEEETAPLIAIYRERGIVKEVNGLGEIAEVTERILDALK
jgi:adenylate kinase